MSLKAFLNPIKEENLKFAASKRFIDENGNLALWEVKAMTTAEDEILRKECTRKVAVPGKYGQTAMEVDYDMYLGKLAAACTISPNLKDAELQKAYDVMGEDKLLKKMLKPGEYAAYLKKIQEINCFDEPTASLMDEAKN